MTKVQAACVAPFLLLATWTSSQGPKEPVWVAQAPPFGTIATLGGFPDLPAFYPMAGPLVTDLRLSEEWNSWGLRPVRFVRLTRVGDDVRGSLLLWWIGNLGPDEPTARASARCTTPEEGLRVCIQPIAVNTAYEWGPLLRSTLAADPCPEPRPTHIYQLKAQVFDRSQGPFYRLMDICDPLATKASEVFNELVVAAKK